MMNLLSQIPDAQGTRAYLKLMRCIVDSYLDKTLSPIVRLEKAWYAVFFVRYWRSWLLHNPDYTLEKNFITSNAYACIELNAHAVQDVLPQSNRRKTPALQQSKILKSKLQLYRGCLSSELRNFVYSHYQPHA